MSYILNWTPEHERGFSKTNLLFTHGVNPETLFSDEALIALIDRYPRDRLEVFSMGYDPTNWGQWYLGRRGDHDGRALLEGVKAGRLWLNLRKTNHIDPDFARLCEAMFSEIKNKTGVSTLKQDLGLLISSPNAHVFYHLDMPLVMLWQMRGIKRVYLYPPEAPCLNDKDLEGIALRESDEQLKFDPEWDRLAFVHDLLPGQMLSWKQNAPHRIVNHDVVNVSMSIEFMTPKALWRANLIYANGVLRRRFKLNPSLLRSLKIFEPLKIIFARLVKLMGGAPSAKSPISPRFSLDAQKAHILHFDEGVEVPKVSSN